MTKILVVSDIHANLNALEAVLSDAKNYDGVWCLGDLVGYGPDPNECIQIIRFLPNLVCLLGNHDAAILGQIDVESFNREASQSALWTRRSMCAESLEYLKTLPETVVEQGVTLAHGSPRNPVWEYLLDIYTARDNFGYFNTKTCLVGHTHVPLTYQLSENSQVVTLKQFTGNTIHPINTRAILNPGSVGQPRDYDPRSSYAIYHLEEQRWESHRVEYDIHAVQKRILAAGLPARHAERLEMGW